MAWSSQCTSICWGPPRHVLWHALTGSSIFGVVQRLRHWQCSSGAEVPRWPQGRLCRRSCPEVHQRIAYIITHCQSDFHQPCGPTQSVCMRFRSPGRSSRLERVSDIRGIRKSKGRISSECRDVALVKVRRTYMFRRATSQKRQYRFLVLTDDSLDDKWLLLLGRMWLE